MRDSEILGEQILKACDTLGVSRYQLSRLLGNVEKPDFIYPYIKGTRSMPKKYLIRLIKILDDARAGKEFASIDYINWEDDLIVEIDRRGNNGEIRRIPETRGRIIPDYEGVS